MEIRARERHNWKRAKGGSKVRNPEQMEKPEETQETGKPVKGSRPSLGSQSCVFIHQITDSVRCARHAGPAPAESCDWRYLLDVPSFYLGASYQSDQI